MHVGSQMDMESQYDQDGAAEQLSQSAKSASSAGELANWTLKDGSVAAIRFICPVDEPLMVKFHETLSENSVYFRYLGPLRLSQRIAHRRLRRVCLNDYDHDLALVAVRRDARSREEEILAVGRLVKFEETGEAEFALVVADACQGSGLGTYLLRWLIWMARNQGQRQVVGYILPDNRQMLRICEKLGFRRIHPPGDPVVKVELDLSAADANGPR